MNLATPFARTLTRSTDALTQRATALGFAALVTLGMLGGVNALATSPAQELPTMAQQADAPSRG